MRVHTRRGLQVDSIGDSTTSSASWKHTRITRMYLSVYGMFWWTWTGSNRRHLPCHGSQINHLQTSSSWFHALTDAHFGPRLARVISSMLFRTLPGPRNPAAFGPRLPRTFFFTRTR